MVLDGGANPPTSTKSAIDMLIAYRDIRNVIVLLMGVYSVFDKATSTEVDNSTAIVVKTKTK